MYTHNVPDRVLTHNLYKTVYLLQKFSSGVLHENFSLTFSQYRILLAIEHKPRLSQSDIAQYHGLTRAAVTRQIELLKSKGYIEVKTNTSNRREHTLKITPVGREYLRKVLLKVNRETQKIFSVLSGSQQRTLKSALEKLIGTLGSFKENC